MATDDFLNGMTEDERREYYAHHPVVQLVQVTVSLLALGAAWIVFVLVGKWAGWFVNL